MGNRDNSDIIVIGLTGPFGSGCTTFAKFFDKSPDKEKGKINFIDYLRANGYFPGENGKEKELLDNRIYDFYELLEKVDDILKRPLNRITEMELKIMLPRIFKQFENKDKILKFVKNERKKKYSAFYADKENIEGIKERIFSGLKVLLEEREVLNALSGETSKLAMIVDKSNPEKHRFKRISLSDIIIFKTLLNVDEKEFDEGENIQKSVEEYNKKVKSMAEEKDINIDKKINEDIKAWYKNFSKVTQLSKEELKKIEEYRKLMQDFGDNIRKCGNPYDYKTTYEKKNVISEKLVREDQDTKYELVKEVKNLIELLGKKENHKVFIVDALRNPHEVLYLRKHFLNFYLISLFAPNKLRKERIDKKGKDSFNKDDERDSGEGVKGVELLYKQNVTLCSTLADVAINNYVAEDEGENEYFTKPFRRKIEKGIYSLDDFKRKIVRYFALMINKGCTKPNDDEQLMNQAYAVAMKSNCISRQVGAVIVDDEGYIIGAGWNDVGEGHISCGLIEIKDLRKGLDESNPIGIFQKYLKYILNNKVEKNNTEQVEEWEDLLKKFYTDIHEEHCVCFNELSSMKKFEKKFGEKFNKEKDNIKKEVDKTYPDNLNLAKDIKEIIDKININKIYQKKIEHCRALHAEENAILQSARRGGMGLKGAKIYTTTYPCSLCARKILQVGIREVIYDDSYPDKLSEMFLQEGQKRVDLRHFEGVKPLGYFRLFKPVYNQKEWQELKIKHLLEKYSYKSKEEKKR